MFMHDITYIRLKLHAASFVFLLVQKETINQLEIIKKVPYPD